jgi:hypothetical protein
MRPRRFDFPKHPLYHDFEVGMNDGTETYPYITPGEREGESLEADREGYEFGQGNVDSYYTELDYTERVD